MPRRWVVMQAHHAEPLELRPATEVDQPAIVDICKTSITTTYGVFMNPERMRPWVDGQEVENYVARMWPRMTVAVDDGQVLGVVALDGHVIDLLWIRADRRGRGIGSVLMERMRAENDFEHLDPVFFTTSQLICVHSATIFRTTLSGNNKKREHIQMIY